MLHLLPSLKTLQLSFGGFDVPGEHMTETGAQAPQILYCCVEYGHGGRTKPSRLWQGLYHDYIKIDLYENPDLAAAFHSRLSHDSQAKWLPPVEYLAHAPHHTAFNSFSKYEMDKDTAVVEKSGAKFAVKGEVNKWKGISSLLETLVAKSNGVYYLNYYWYIVSQRKNVLNAQSNTLDCYRLRLLK